LLSGDLLRLTDRGSHGGATSLRGLASHSNLVALKPGANDGMCRQCPTYSRVRRAWNWLHELS
jgi:hypothetical protein